MGETVRFQAVDGPRIGRVRCEACRGADCGIGSHSGDLWCEPAHSFDRGRLREGRILCCGSGALLIEWNVALSFPTKAKDAKKGMALLQKTDIVKALADVDAALASLSRRPARRPA